MTNLEENMEVLRYLNGINPDEFKDVKLDGKNLIYNGKTLPLDKINIKNIVNANEKLLKEIYTMKMESLFNILKINSDVMAASLKTGSFNIKDRNTELINQVKKGNEVLKNITVINKDHDFSHEQYFNMIDSSSKVHMFKNDRDFDLSIVMDEYLMKNDKNLDSFISLVSRYLPEVSLDNTLNMDNNSYVSEDFKNKIDGVKKEFEGKQGVHVYGNENEDIITIVDTLHPENNETRTYKRDNDGNLVVEKYGREKEENDKAKDNSKEELKENEEQLEDKTKKEEEKVELIPFQDFLDLNNSPNPLNKEQESQVKLWEQTLGDMYIYEEYLSEEVLQYFKKYHIYISELEVYKEQGMLNKNQINAVEKFYELTNPLEKKQKLEGMSEERKDELKRKLEKSTSNKDGKVSLMVILSIIFMSCLSIVYLISTMFR
ncbi:MAG: hypothetical protein E7158_02575 [Firmicutes bacterium]|nr:hypothetical protein [Bacillota bacterium]